MRAKKNWHSVAWILLFPICLNAQDVPTCKWQGADLDNFISNDLLSNNFVPEILSKLNAKKAECADDANKARFSKCLDRISGYFQQFDQSKGGMFTGRMSDSDYLASQPQDVMTLPPELNTASNALPANWREIAKEKGWKFALFQSGTANEGRLVIYLPGEKYDRMLVYYGFGSPPGSDPTKYDGLQMQAIEKKAKDSKELPHYYFKSWGFTGPDHTPVSRSSGGRCVVCHISGPRAIEPLKNPAFPTELGGVANLEQLNKLIVHDGPIDYSPYYDPKNFPDHLSVGESGRCTECHDGKTRQSLAYSVFNDGRFLMENIHRKVVREKTMPYFDDDHLTDEQRDKLVSYIGEDYRNKLKKWLTETKCSSLDGSSKNPDSKPVSPAQDSGLVR